MSLSLPRRAAAEGLGTGLLVTAVVGSGIMAERLADGQQALALLANTLATGGALVALILTFGPLSGAHFNPVVSACLAAARKLPARDAVVYVVAQLAGGLLGSAVANTMFGAPPFTWATTDRSGLGRLLGEVVATFGLVGVVVSTGRRQPAMAPFAVAAYIVGAYWFTSSTSFANPAVTLARAVSDSFAGIRPADVPGFILAQLAGGAVALVVFSWLDRESPGGSGFPIGGG